MSDQSAKLVLPCVRRIESVAKRERDELDEGAKQEEQEEQEEQDMEHKDNKKCKLDTEVKQEETKQEETKQDIKQEEETKKEETKQEDIKQEVPKEETKSEEQAPEPEKNKMRWFVVGDTPDNGGDPGLAELKHLDIPASILRINSYEKNCLSLTWNTIGGAVHLSAKIKSREVLQFPAEYAFFASREIEGLKAFDATEWYEHKFKEEKCEPHHLLYGLSCSGHFMASLPSDTEGNAPCL